MPILSYRQTGLILRAGGTAANERQIRDLQRDLRRLGYLKSGIDGAFGGGTERAVKALQHDLMNNDGGSRGGDGEAPVRVLDFNRGRVALVTGEVDQPLVECISDILDTSNFPRLPSAANPGEENRRIVAQMRELPPAEAPTPFLMAVLKQESDLKHFHEPTGRDEDTFIVVGLDARKEQEHIITSRGYGAGQYTLFHHPARPEELTDFMLDVGKNVQRASRELREKFDHFVNGPTPNARADDRQAEFGPGPLRLCKFSRDDPRFMKDCRQCLLEAGLQDIRAGVTPLFPGSGRTYEPTELRSNFTVYEGVPIRREIGCDWPYAVRRYNGSGMDSYHYQAQVLVHLKTL